MMTSELLVCERWDIAVALFPFTDMAQQKPRPVVILSNASFNRDHRHHLAVMITTGADSSWPSDHAIQDLGPTGLRSPSLVRWKLFTLPTDVLARRIGMLGEVDRSLLTARMASILLG